MKKSFYFESVVVKGRGEGSKLDYPTVNLVHNKLDIDYGVYVCRVKTDEGDFHGALNYGIRPTFNLSEPACEIFLLDFSGDLYDQKVRVTVYNKIREEMRFASVEKLKEQIGRDVLSVRKFFKSNQ